MELLRLARATLEALLCGRALPVVPGGWAGRVSRGAFVTLSADGALRGCIGRVVPDRPLAALVRDMAVAAARDDPRFPPVVAEELSGVRLEISVLTAPAPLAAVLPELVVIGRDGLIVRRGEASGLLLPQVAAEHGWRPDLFLAAACRKAGLAGDAWREPGTEVLTFQAEVFGE
ncbi:MAG: AmmeMemoRadiSam system protein A [Gemmatimonadales bacterium]